MIIQMPNINDNSNAKYRLNLKRKNSGHTEDRTRVIRFRVLCAAATPYDQIWEPGMQFDT